MQPALCSSQLPGLHLERIWGVAEGTAQVGLCDPTADQSTGAEGKGHGLPQVPSASVRTLRSAGSLGGAAGAEH